MQNRKIALAAALVGPLCFGCTQAERNQVAVSPPTPTFTPKPPAVKANPTPTPTPLATLPSPSPVGGLPESRRRAIFKEVFDAEGRAQREVEARYNFATQPERHMELLNDLQEKYRNEVRASYHLSKKEFDALCIEGVKKRWPPLGD